MKQSHSFLKYYVSTVTRPKKFYGFAINHENLLAIRNNVLILSRIMNLNYTDQIFKFLRVKNSMTLKEVFHEYAHVRAMNKPPVNSIVFETIRTLET